MARRLLMLLMLLVLALIIALGIYYLGSQKNPNQVSQLVGLIQSYGFTL